MWFLPILTGALFAWAGRIAARRPQALSGIDLLPRRRRSATDIRALGRYCARLLYVCAAIEWAGAALLPLLRHETAVAIILCLPIPVLLAGWGWGWIRYDKKFKKP